MKRFLSTFTAMIMLLACFSFGAQPAEAEAYDRGALFEFNGELVRLIRAHSDLSFKDAGAYSTARIIAGSSRTLDYSGSLAHVYGCGRHVIRYAAPEQAMAAVERYRGMNGVEYAVPDALMIRRMAMGLIG